MRASVRHERMKSNTRMNNDRTRPRGRVLFFLSIVIGIGIWSRIPGAGLTWSGKAFGDTVWATMFYLWVLLIAPRISIYS